MLNLAIIMLRNIKEVINANSINSSTSAWVGINAQVIKLLIIAKQIPSVI